MVGGIAVGSPLQNHVYTRPPLEDEEGVFGGNKLPYPTGEVSRAGNSLQHGCRSAAVGGVAGDVTGKIGRNEGGPLVRHPEGGVDPADPGYVRPGVVDGIGADPGVSLRQGQGTAVFQHVNTDVVTLNVAAVVAEAEKLEVGVCGLGSLTVLGHPTDGGDGPGVVVLALDAPGGDRCVVHRSAEGEVGFQVVFEGIHLFRSAEGVFKFGVVHHGIQDGEPVAGGCFALGAVGPELGQDAGVVSARHYVGRVGFAGSGVDGVPLGAEGAALVYAVELRVVGKIRRVIALEIAECSGADVPHHAVGRVQVAAPLQYKFKTPAVHIEGIRAAGDVDRRRTGIVVNGVVAPDRVFGRRVGAVLLLQGEGHNLPPLSSQKW